MAPKISPPGQKIHWQQRGQPYIKLETSMQNILCTPFSQMRRVHPRDTETRQGFQGCRCTSRRQTASIPRTQPNTADKFPVHLPARDKPYQNWDSQIPPHSNVWCCAAPATFSPGSRLFAGGSYCSRKIKGGMDTQDSIRHRVL